MTDRATAGATSGADNHREVPAVEPLHSYVVREAAGELEAIYRAQYSDGRGGIHAASHCLAGDLAIKVPDERCGCGHLKEEHHPCGSCEHACGCLQFRRPSSERGGA